MREISAVLQEQRQFFASGKTRELAFRREMLLRLQRLINRNEQAIFAALHQDLKKPACEAYATEVGMVRAELSHALKKLGTWARPRRVRTPLAQFPASSYLYQDPYGVALIVAPWNYPFNLALAPLIGAVAAGNCVVLKPSELASATSTLLARLLGEAFPEHYLAVIEGGIEVNQALLEESFDKIFFTGSVGVGRLVMAAAARNLTPVTLELGGKSPCIVERDANLDLAARRIVWGKFLNAGQTCVAPDYILVHEEIKDDLVRRMVQQIAQFYGADPAQSPDYPRIVNRRHFDRLQALLQKGQIVTGGTAVREDLYLAPTLIEAVDWQDPLMQEEIFGPILPVISFATLDEALQIVEGQPRPLALYLFSNNRKVQRRIMAEVSFGGGCINDTILHLANPNLPFGGVGTSGMGSYHGQASFTAFSHQKSVLKKALWLDIPLRYAPYAGKLKWLKLFLR
ncbi:MAG: aldehyde dehydrogenase [Geopsychrobacter sp.]|nr:aldehyde dehydrogenase [Geopsychrobacter sp.]